MNNHMFTKGAKNTKVVSLTFVILALEARALTVTFNDDAIHITVEGASML